MGRVVVSEFVSVDGVMEDPGGSEGTRNAGWTFRFDRGTGGDRFKLDEVLEAEALLLGRVTYQGFAAAWPTIEDPVGFAAKMNAMPKYVVSSTLSDDDADWNNSTVLRGAAVAELTALKARVAGDLLVNGSASLVQLLAEHDLVDEYRLMVFPTLLGSGKRLFGDLDIASDLHLEEVQKVGDDGIVVFTYRPRAGATVGTDDRVV
ncbi:MAG TPA: dihydrofolate reductase family protein [Acidimicrobiales bacterium]|jgi:dihydrofolate reductase|nr:dihydrofolate reductase family protein [Acidimicrobiales bacterium]